MPSDQFRQRIIDIAAGRIVPKRGEPKIWFHSMKSLAEVLSDSNRELLKIIADQTPNNIKELAEITGRQPSNLGRTLSTFEHYGFVKMIKNAKEKRPVAQVTDFDISISA